MEENMMEMTNEVVDVVDTMDEVAETVAESKGGLVGGILTGVGIVGVGAACVALFKNRDKIKEKKLKKQIAKLEKAGFVVAKPEDLMEDLLDDIDDLDEKESEE